MKTEQLGYAIIAKKLNEETQKTKTVAFLFSDKIPEAKAYQEVAEIYEHDPNHKIVSLETHKPPYETWAVILEDEK